MQIPSLIGIFIFLCVLAAVTESAITSQSTSSKPLSTRTSTSSKTSSFPLLSRPNSSLSSLKKYSSSSSSGSAKSFTSLLSSSKKPGATSSTLSRSTTSTLGPSSSKTGSASKSSSVSSKSSSVSRTSSFPVHSSSSSKSTLILSSQAKTSSILSLQSSSRSSIKSSTTRLASSTSQLKSVTTQSSHSSLSSSIKSSTTNKSYPTVRGGSSTIYRSTSSTKASNALTTAIVSTSSQGTPSIALVTPTSCPWISTGSLIWQNATSETSAVGIFGTFDQYGYPATATRLGIWNGSRINSIPDLIIDITNPAMLVASFTKDLHNIVLDTVNNQMHISNCSIEAIVPLPPTIKKRTTDQSPAPVPEKRQDYEPAGSIQVTLTYTTPCGNPDQWQTPDVDCGNVTPGLWPNMVAPVSQVIQTAPGVYSTTCYFPDIIDGRKDSPLCQTVYPLLTEICKVNDATSAPLTGGVLEAYCLYLAATIILEELAVICAIFVGGLGLYCMVQTEFNGGLYGNGFHDALCGPDVSSTDLNVRVTSGFPHDTWYNPSLDLGTQNSDSPKDISITVPNKVSPGATCTPCKNSNQQCLTPWVQAYAGNMFLRQDFDCQGYWYSGYLGDSSQYSFSQAQAECQIIAENNMASVWYADSETFTDNDGSPTAGPFFGCWVTGCDIQASDFTLDFNALNPSATSFIVEDVVAFHRTVEWVNCVN